MSERRPKAPGLALLPGALLLGALLLAGCAGGLGDFCISDRDCRSGLRCSAPGGGRGVCTYPGVLLDLGARDRAADHPGEVAARELGGDHARDRAVDRDHAVDRAAERLADRSSAEARREVSAPDLAAPDRGVDSQPLDLTLAH